MKKWLYGLLLPLLWVNSHLLSSDRGTSVALRCSAFVSSGQTFRDLYGVANPTFGIEIARWLYPRYEAWFSLDYFHVDCFMEKIDDYCCKTAFGDLNGNLGVRYCYPLHYPLSVYIGMGASIAWADLHNQICCGNERFSRFGVGAIFQSGISYQTSDNYFLRFFLDYLWQSVQMERSVNIGGAKLGIAIGRTL